jgi:hypothetical protein
MDQRIEDAVVRADLKFLESVYAKDFRFTHGTGNVQSKDEWLKSVAKRGFLSRKSLPGRSRVAWSCGCDVRSFGCD